MPRGPGQASEHTLIRNTVGGCSEVGAQRAGWAEPSGPLLLWWRAFQQPLRLSEQGSGTPGPQHTCCSPNLSGERGLALPVPSRGLTARRALRMDRALPHCLQRASGPARGRSPRGSSRTRPPRQNPARQEAAHLQLLVGVLLGVLAALALLAQLPQLGLALVQSVAPAPLLRLVLLQCGLRQGQGTGGSEPLSLSSHGQARSTSKPPPASPCSAPRTPAEPSPSLSRMGKVMGTGTE